MCPGNMEGVLRNVLRDEITPNASLWYFFLVTHIFLYLKNIRSTFTS